MIDERCLLDEIKEELRGARCGFMTAEYRGGYNAALGDVIKIIGELPKVGILVQEEPVIIKTDQEEIRNKLRDLEFERDFYKMHFEDLYRRKVEG